MIVWFFRNSNIELAMYFLENKTGNPFSRSKAPTEDFHCEFDKNILASSILIYTLYTYKKVVPLSISILEYFNCFVKIRIIIL